jgi:hypothetical protein
MDDEGSQVANGETQTDRQGTQLADEGNQVAEAGTQVANGGIQIDRRETQLADE